MTGDELTFLDLLKTWEAVFGLVAMGFGAVSGLIIWVDRRAAKRSAGEVRNASQSRDIETRVAGIENRLGEVEKEIEAVEGAIGSMKAEMGHLAKADAVANLRVSVAELTGAVRATAGKVDTMYRAALEAGVKAAGR